MELVAHHGVPALIWRSYLLVFLGGVFNPLSAMAPMHALVLITRATKTQPPSLPNTSHPENNFEHQERVFAGINVRLS